MPQISIILVSYNSTEHISSCLDSIHEKGPAVEVIVVDNASSDDIVKKIKTDFSEAILICNEQNLGFSAAINQGIRKAKGKYILVLNSDVTLERDFIKRLSAKIEQIPKNVGMISPRIMRPDGQIDSAGLSLSWLRRFYDRGRGRRNGSRFALPAYIFGPCAACAIYKREMLEDIKIGEEYFDEDFFLLVEDFDVAWRTNLCGWKGWFMPELTCLHRQNGISRKRSKIAQYYTFRNRYLLLIKNESKWGLFRLIIFAWIYDFPRLIYLLYTNRYTIKALKEIKQLLPLMRKKRSFVRGKVKNIKQYKK